jgi:hypothetical protein
MSGSRHDEPEIFSELIQPSEKFMAAIDGGMLISALLIVFVGWRRKVARKRSPNSPIPEV